MRYMTGLAKRVGLRSYLPAKYIIDFSLWTLAAPLAFVVRHEWEFVDYPLQLLIYSGIGLGIKVLLYLSFGYGGIPSKAVGFQAIKPKERCPPMSS